jgi:hypothetical protein
MDSAGKGDKSLSRQSRAKKMEASEQSQSRRGGDRFALRHVDPALMIDELAPERRASGFARLNLMVNAVFPRLVAGQPRSRAQR